MKKLRHKDDIGMVWWFKIYCGLTFLLKDLTVIFKYIFLLQKQTLLFLFLKWCLYFLGSLSRVTGTAFPKAMNNNRYALSGTATAVHEQYPPALAELMSLPKLIIYCEGVA